MDRQVGMELVRRRRFGCGCCLGTKAISNQSDTVVGAKASGRATDDRQPSTRPDSYSLVQYDDALVVKKSVGHFKPLFLAVYGIRQSIKV